MLPSRFVPGQASAIRKSRLEGKPSMLPKPRRPGSTDRLSTETRRPSSNAHRSSSAEPRGTFGTNRLSREASATKIQLNGRSRSQQGDRFAQSSMTPLRSSQYSRPATTPVRTPSEDRSNRSWQTSLERALAFVTVKDVRPVSNAAWQRAVFTRVQEALAQRAGEGAAAAAFIRPLTIARFVEVTGALLAAITRDAKLNTDNYVTKLPNLSKWVLYPGTVSKSWLKTVNTLHAFPHALALVAYLLDLVQHIETPVSDEWLYVGKDDLSCLRRDYLFKCWIRFQDPGYQFEDLNEEYLQNLKLLLGNDEEKIMELQQVIQKYEACLEDEVEASARADEARRRERREAALSALRAERAARRELAGREHGEAAARAALGDALRQLDAELERAAAESQQLKREVEEQPLSVAERARLLDELDYGLRVVDSKRALAVEIDKMLLSKETELALWQKKSLDSCVEYKQGLIHLSAQFPDIATLAIDEKELMGSECAARLSSAVEALRQRAQRLGERRAHVQRTKTQLQRRTQQLLEETRAKISEAQSSIQREQQMLEQVEALDGSEAAAHTALQHSAAQRLEALRALTANYERADAELAFWLQQDAAWRDKLGEMRARIASERGEAERALCEAARRRALLLQGAARGWHGKLARPDAKQP